MIRISTPDINGRKEIFDYFLGRTKFNKDIDINSLCNRTIGFSGADIKNLVNQSAIHAVKNNKKQIEKEDLEFAIDRLLLGVRKCLNSLCLTNYDKRATAVT